jgi:hypothetical protein
LTRVLPNRTRMLRVQGMPVSCGVIMAHRED